MMSGETQASQGNSNLILQQFWDGQFNAGQGAQVMLINPTHKDMIPGFIKKPINGLKLNLIKNRTKVQENCTEYDHKTTQP